AAFARAKRNRSRESGAVVQEYSDLACTFSIACHDREIRLAIAIEIAGDSAVGICGGLGVERNCRGRYGKATAAVAGEEVEVVAARLKIIVDDGVGVAVAIKIRHDSEGEAAKSKFRSRHRKALKST